MKEGTKKLINKIKVMDYALSPIPGSFALGQVLTSCRMIT
jgi:hypothetical protein